MFSNAKSVEINGKEVKSIILENGAILYKKDESYSLSVTSDKNILSHYDNDVATLTATLTQGGVPVEGEEVKFYITEDIPAGLSFTGTNFTVSSSSSGLSGNNIVIDWGDGSTTTYTGVSSLNHTYATEGDYAISLGGNITSFNDYCFKECSGLISIVIPDSVTRLGEACFYECSGLTSVFIPDSVTNIGMGCFWVCFNLTSVVIPDTITNIGNYCFNGCSSLTSVIFNWETNIPTYNSNWFANISVPQLSIPNGTLQVYIDAGYPSNKIVERSE